MPQAGIGFDTLDTSYDRETGATFIVRHREKKATGNRVGAYLYGRPCSAYNRPR